MFRSYCIELKKCLDNLGEKNMISNELYAKIVKYTDLVCKWEEGSSGHADKNEVIVRLSIMEQELEDNERAQSASECSEIPTDMWRSTIVDLFGNDDRMSSSLIDRYKKIIPLYFVALKNKKIDQELKIKILTLVRCMTSNSHAYSIFEQVRIINFCLFYLRLITDPE